MDCRQTNRKAWKISAVLGAVTFFIYARVAQNGFVNFDDGTYITENPVIQNGFSLSNILWAFSTSYATNWHPVTWLSHFLDYQLYGLNPAGHHLTNLLLHIGNTLLLFHVLRRMTGALWRSAVVAALFAWHPLHVESVAWAAERKDVLSAFFWLLTMLAYFHYVEDARAGGGRTRNYYALTILCYALGLLSKPMLVTLPFVLLLLDCWPLARTPLWKRPGAANPATVPWKRLILEKTPLFAMAAASSAVTFIVQRSGGAVASLNNLSPIERLSNALLAYVLYLWKMIWPLKLSIFYPLHPERPAWQWVGAAVLLIALSYMALRFRKRAPYFAVGWFWYLGTLIPVIGLVQVGSQSMADRYTYMPLVGIFIVLAWGAADLLGNWGGLKTRAPAWAMSVPILAACAVLTGIQAGYWKDSETLFRHALKVTERNTLAHVNLGEALDKAGRPAEAKAELLKALELEPESPKTLTSLGTLAVHNGDVTNALRYFSSALSKHPMYGDAHYNLGNLLAHEGDLAGAANHYAISLEYNYDAPDAHNNLGAVLLRMGHYQDAADQFMAALRLRPNYPEAEEQLGVAYAKLGRPDLAKIHYAEALRLNPNFSLAHQKLGLILASEGNFDQAIPHFLATVRLDPTNTDGYYNLGGIYAIQGRLDEAVEQYGAIIKLTPSDAEAHGRLAAIQVVRGDYEAAIPEYREAMRLRPGWADPMRDLAWVMATCPKAELRNPSESLKLADRACDLAGKSDPRYLSALDAAYAANGEFDEAIKTATQILNLATNAASQRFAAGAKQRLEFYRAGKPFIDQPAPAPTKQNGERDPRKLSQN